MRDLATLRRPHPGSAYAKNRQNDYFRACALSTLEVMSICRLQHLIPGLGAVKIVVQITFIKECISANTKHYF